MPNSPPGLPNYAEKAALQMSVYGNILNLWGQAELAVEMVVKEELRLSTVEACIVCGPLGSGAKINLAKALLAASGNKPEFAPAIRDFQTIVGRNALAHGFATYEKPEDDWSIVYRDIKDSLTVKSKTFVRYLQDDVIPAFDRVVLASGFTDQQMHDYGREIAALAR